MEEINPYEAPASSREQATFLSLPAESWVMPLLQTIPYYAILYVLMRWDFVSGIAFSSIAIGLAIGLAIGVVNVGMTRVYAGRKLAQMMMEPPKFRGVRVLAGGTARMKIHGWPKRTVLVFVTTGALVLRENVTAESAEVVIPLREIVTVRRRGLSSLVITRRDGTSQKMRVGKVKIWLDEIERALAMVEEQLRKAEQRGG